MGQPVLPGTSPLGVIFFPGQQLPGTSFKNTLGRDQVPILYPPLSDDLHPTSPAGISNSHHPFLPTWLLFLVPQTCALFPQAVTVTLSPHLTGILFLFFFFFFVVLPYSWETAGRYQDTSQSSLRFQASLSPRKEFGSINEGP